MKLQSFRFPTVTTGLAGCHYACYKRTMKTACILTLLSFAAAPLLAADPAEEIKAAAQKLADKGTYAWTAKNESPQADRAARGGGFGPASGKTEKGGFTYIAWTGRDSKTEAIKKGDKFVLKTGEEWQTASELEDGGGDNQRARFTSRRVQNFKLPAQETIDLVGKVKNIKKEGDAYTAELTPEALKQMYTFGRRPGGGDSPAAGPDVSKLKGTAKFWIKDGVLSKYQTHVTGSMAFGQDGREIDVDRTNTFEITDVGTAKVEVPAEAKKKLGSS